MKRILITGSRTWENSDTILEALDYHGGDYTTVVSGHCPIGADDMAEDAAHAMGMDVEEHPADWKKHGRRAGFVRNAEMVALGADLCLAFIRDNSKGATMTADLAMKAGIETIIYRETK